MKHDVKVISILAIVFFLSQIMGLAVINGYIDHKTTEETGNVTFSDLPYNIERPEIEEDKSLYFILTAILVGTILILFIIKIKKFFLWKLWFFFSVFITLFIAFAAFEFVNQHFAAFLALILAIWKIQRPNVYIHNLTEIFIYGGLAAIFVPIINMFAIILLLIIISLYDVYAVWHSKHMIKMAKFQSQSKVFAGIVIPYIPSLKKQKTQKKEKTIIKKRIESLPLGGQKIKAEEKPRNAVVGGGDLGFPLLFAGVVMKKLMLLYPVTLGFLLSAIIPIITTISLFLLLYYGKHDRFYPAMPFLAIGCFLGYGIVFLLHMVI